MAFNKIVLIERGYKQDDEAIAIGIFKPGHHLKFDSDGKVLKFSTAGGFGELIFAKEDSYQGKTITDAYAVADRAKIHHGQRGDHLQVRLPANAPAVTRTDLLVPDGTGCFVKNTGVNSLLYQNVAASAAHTNTVTAADFDKTYSIPANSLAVGDVIRIRAQVIATATNSTDTLTLLLTLGGVTLATTGAVDVANGDIGYFEATVIIRTIGASGTFVASGVQSLGVPGTVTAKPFLLGSTAIDTTAANVVAVNADWSVASASNSARLDVLTVERLRTSDQVFGGGGLAVALESVDNSAVAAEAFIKARLL